VVDIKIKCGGLDTRSATKYFLGWMKVVKLLGIWITAGAICFGLYISGLTEKWNYGEGSVVYLHIPKYPGEKFYIAEKDPNFKPKIKVFDKHPALRILGMVGVAGIALTMTIYTLRKSDRIL